ncbi:MAG: glycosyltransferase family 4 protein [Candidatus Acidiferrales bacterium]
MKLLFLSRYGRLGASSRYRFWQYLPLFERAGHQVEICPLVDDSYLRSLYENGRRPWLRIFFDYTRRILKIRDLRNFDAVICEQEAFPYLPSACETYVRRRCQRFFVDYDDAAHVRYKRWPFLRNKISGIMAEADGVVVGNPYLAQYARQFNPRVTIIPTVVDLARYPARSRVNNTNLIRVAWIGTPVTAKLLIPLVPTLQRLQQEYRGLVFRFIGAGQGGLFDGLSAETPEWSEEQETKLLADCDLGIMPLPDDEFTRGKCGLKLIQYMACYLPVVASPVGVNREIVEHGRNGFLASDPAEWHTALRRLVEDAQLRKNMGRAARDRVEERYTLERGFGQWQQVIEGFSKGRKVMLSAEIAVGQRA